MRTIVAYDISSNRRRTRICNLLKDYGERIQYSVFECELTPQRLDELRARLAPFVHPKTDRIHFCPLCRACFARATSIGAAYPPLDL